MQSRAPFARIGTRGSPLALYQAHLVRRLLAHAAGVAEGEIAVEVITTTGDRLVDRSLIEEGGKGLFTKEIETALFEDRVDIGVHSAKDVATVLPRGLVLVAMLPREDVRDAFVALGHASLEALPPGARLGTSSVRRAAQMLRHRPDLAIVPFRGNVDTRLRKLADGVADATLLAVAGLNRLGRADRITAFLDPLQFPPAPAQGAITLQIRAGDERMHGLLAPLDHGPTARAVAAERALLRKVEGSCRTPLGVYTRMEGGELRLRGEVLSADGALSFIEDVAGSADRPEALGAALGEALLARAGPTVLRSWGMAV